MTDSRKAAPRRGAAADPRAPVARSSENRATGRELLAELLSELLLSFLAADAPSLAKLKDVTLQLLSMQPGINGISDSTSMIKPPHYDKLQL